MDILPIIFPSIIRCTNWYLSPLMACPKYFSFYRNREIRRYYWSIPYRYYSKNKSIRWKVQSLSRFSIGLL